MNAMDTFVDSERDRILGQLMELLRIPSVSADPECADSCRRAAAWVRDHLDRIGCAPAELLGSDSHPVVCATGPVIPGAPTVLVYGHYDVQPPDPLTQWHTPPFEPTVRDGNLYARGATDDKGQFFALITACEAALAQGQSAVNLRFLIEGGEEVGGEVLLDLVRERPDLLDADIVVIADGPYYAPGWPCAEVAVRGICYAEVVARTLREDVHSGLYGGVAPNAHEALVGILHGLKDRRGRIRIPGLYATVRRPGRLEREGWSELPFDLQAFTTVEVGAGELVGDPRRTVHERLWALPTLDIHGITGGFTGDGIKTVIPAEARAKISLRLVADQRAEEVFAGLEARVRALTPPWARVSVEPLILSDPVAVDTSHPAFSRLDSAFREVVGRGIVFTRSGGSLPILEVLGSGGAAVLVAGIGLPDDHLHAPNERISINQFFDGIRVYARFFAGLGDHQEGEAS
jgi:acetylornithine deacetylase/succinyl-diaminopimelate desuccinylase-like protein